MDAAQDVTALLRRQNDAHTLGTTALVRLAGLDPREATLEVEYLRVGVEGDVACAVALERSRYQGAAADTMSVGYTRATHSFRREEGA
jgi:hypothetical protein